MKKEKYYILVTSQSGFIGIWRLKADNWNDALEEAEEYVGNNTNKIILNEKMFNELFDQMKELKNNWR